MLKRITCLMAAVLLVISSGAPAMAVTPQEGWFIRDIETVDGIDYYVIDNKLSADNWLVDLSGGNTYSVDTLLPSIIGTSETHFISWVDDIYRGFSDVDWRVDNDWLLRVYVSSVSGTRYSYDDVANALTNVALIAYDRTRVPIITAVNPSVGLVNASSNTFIGSLNCHGKYVLSTSLIGNTVYIPMSTFFYGVLLDNVDFTGTNFTNAVNWVDVDGTCINDLCIGVIPNADSAEDNWRHCEAKIGISFMIPVDKAPSGMAVGDYWPKVRPLEVEIADAFDAYKQTMMDNGQIKDPSDINTMFGQLGDMQEQGLGALEIGDSEGEWITGAYTMMQPLFTFLLPIVGVGVILIIFANKGMHG